MAFQVLESDASDLEKLESIESWCRVYAREKEMIMVNPMLNGGKSIPKQSPEILFAINDFPTFSDVEFKAKASILLLKTVDFDIDKLVLVNPNTGSTEIKESLLIKLCYTPTYDGRNDLRLDIIKAILELHPNVNIRSSDGLNAYSMVVNNRKISDEYKSRILELF